jgi:hypothetical protein
MPELDQYTLLHQVARAVEQALRHAEHGLSAMWWLQHAYCGDRNAVAWFVQRDQWVALREDVQRIAHLLEDASCDLDGLGSALDEPRYVQRHPDDAPVPDDYLIQDIPLDSFVPTAMEAAWAREDRHRGNGADPTPAASFIRSNGESDND